MGKGRSLRWYFAVLGALALAGHSGTAFAAILAGDLNGDGNVDALDEPFFFAAYGTNASSPGSAYELRADLDSNGVVDLQDAALFGAANGASGGDVDVTPPNLLVTLNDIPDDENDLLVVPPDAFQITLHLDSGLESVIDPGSLSVTSSEDIGAATAGTELAANFTVTPTRAIWEIPAGSDLARTSHYLTVNVEDAAGNGTGDSYGFAVRDFQNGTPMENHQVFFLDFGQDRSLGPEIDFLEDLREYGLSDPGTPFIENQANGSIQYIIVERVNEYFGRNPDGTPGVDSVDISFTTTAPGGTYTRLCVGGESQQGASYLGNTVIDVNNRSESTDDCNLGSVYGVFPQAIYALWGSNAELQAAFDPLDPDEGGLPIGQDPIDAYVVSLAVSSADLPAVIAFGGRPADIANAVDAFTQVVATAIAHEAAHMLGLTAAGSAPQGLFGGDFGTANQDHNITAAGGLPSENFIMNRGSSFTFEEMTGRGGEPLPYFRDIGWAYLHDRVALNDDVTGLFPPPILNSIDPNPAVLPGPWTPLDVTFHGDDFIAPVSIYLIIEGDPTPNPILNIVLVDPQTITGRIDPIIAPPGLYDVEITNGDGQTLTLVDYLDVQL